MIENREMAEFAQSLWENYIKFKHKEADADTVSYYKAEVVAKPSSGTLSIQRPLDDTVYDVACPSYMDDVAVGSQVLVLRFGNGTNLMNHFVIDNAARTMLASAIATGSSIAFPISISNGGTGATNAADARANLGITEMTQSYVYEQGVAASTWTIDHNLGFYPSVTVVDSAGNMVSGEVNYASINRVVVSFNGSFAGSAYLS